ncbi:WRKY1 [Tripterygium wilfordii]|uniref:WRKY transcription factor n=1 Tax=Tripterygium wilfordii TaxID=458696 RepID=A0A7J7D5A8_TRIWF|nr:WRKY transcription factor 23-like [Tripterygium wilfordii]KAF5741513.1 WRKY1 [Tripterygium wilfordii]
MEMKQAVKIEGGVGSSPFLDEVQGGYLQGVFDMWEGEKGGSLGFMELLGIQDINGPSSLFDGIHVPSIAQESLSPARPNPPAVTKMEYSSSEVLNPPATPNSSSISSASNEALNDEQAKPVVDEEEEQYKTKKQLKAKKTNQKRQREPSFAFMTKSEVDQLEDGYRWRKYGQKAVKNSPFPRSYYRCTTASCNVKKRVERSFNDPTIVVTTYEGQHTHPSPVMSRSNLVTHLTDSAAFAVTNFAMPMQRSTVLSNCNQYRPQQPFVNGLSTPFMSFGSINAAAGFLQERRFCTQEASLLLKDHGLLQDIVPSHMLKEE